MRFSVCWMLVFAGAASGACVRVSSDRIMARDLFDAAPMLAGLQADLAIGFAPLPGTQRVLRASELAAIANRNGVAVENVPDVCVERALHLISVDEMRAALVAALGIPDAQLDILEFSNVPLPAGRLEFQRSALNQPPPGAPETPVIWRARLVYDGRHSATVWARVRIIVTRPVLIAAEDIPAGTLIQNRHVKSVQSRQFPFSGDALASPDAIMGKIVRRSLKSGQRFTAAMLEEPRDVVKGDIIHVRVIDGQATLSLDAIAQSSGNKGETILVHNSASGRNFRALVEEKGKAVVRSGSGD